MKVCESVMEVVSCLGDLEKVYIHLQEFLVHIGMHGPYGNTWSI